METKKEAARTNKITRGTRKAIRVNDKSLKEMESNMISVNAQNKFQKNQKLNIR